MPSYRYNFDQLAQPEISLPSVDDYLDDFGTKRIFNPVMRIPSDFDLVERVNIVTAAGAVTRIGNNPCPNTTFKPRKLVFLRSNGNSFSIAIPTDDATIMKTTAQAVVDAINAAGTPKVVCVQLVGEVHDDAILSAAPNVVRPAFATIPRIQPSALIAKNAVFYAGTATDYFSDSTQVITPVRFKSLTRIPETALAELAAVFATCAGNVDVSGADLSCSGTSYLNYRRLEVSFATDLLGELLVQTVTMPVADRGAFAEACIAAVAALSGVTCAKYIGEGHDRYHLAAKLTL